MCRIQLGSWAWSCAARSVHPLLHDWRYRNAMLRAICCQLREHRCPLLMTPHAAPHHPCRPNLLFFNVFSSVTLLSYMLLWTALFNIAHVFV